jgi:hypothetical protein
MGTLKVTDPKYIGSTHSKKLKKIKNKKKIQ